MTTGRRSHRTDLGWWGGTAAERNGRKLEHWRENATGKTRLAI
jgi:hypothetical protein